MEIQSDERQSVFIYSSQRAKLGDGSESEMNELCCGYTGMAETDEIIKVDTRSKRKKKYTKMD